MHLITNMHNSHQNIIMLSYNMHNNMQHMIILTCSIHINLQYIITKIGEKKSIKRQEKKKIHKVNDITKKSNKSHLE